MQRQLRAKYQHDGGGEEAESSAGDPEGVVVVGEEPHAADGTDHRREGPGHAHGAAVTAPHFPGGDAGHVGALHGHGDHFTNGEQGHGQDEHVQAIADGVERETGAEDGVAEGDDPLGGEPQGQGSEG